MLHAWRFVLQGPSDALAFLSQAFPSGEPAIVAEGDEVVLRTDRFNTFETNDAENGANRLLASAAALLHIYVGVPSRVRVASLFCSLHGHGQGPYLYGTARCISRDALPRFCAPAVSSPDVTCAAFLLRALSDDAHSHKLLALFGETDPSWADLYVALELMGDQRRLRERHFASPLELSRLFQTANYYRHGKGVSLPTVPFSLQAARDIVRTFAVRWLQERCGAP